MFEIERTAQTLSSIADRLDLDVRPLHGRLSFEEQQRALSPSNRPRVILATNIAETSLTIDGVTRVIDSGLARSPRFDPRSGLDRLELGRISQASATQRAGRAGRTAPGRCIRLWTGREQHAMQPFDAPEIARVDLAPTVLALRQWGVSDPRTFGWFEPPQANAINHAEELLAMLGAIESPRGPITELGRVLAILPVHPRVGRMLLAGVAWDAIDLACTYAAMLSERDFVRDDYESRGPRTIADSDLTWRAMLLAGDGREAFIDRTIFQATRRVREELLRIAKRLKVLRREPPGDVELLLPLVGYPDRVCRRRDRDPAAGAMVGGVGVRLHMSSVCREGGLFVALDARADDRAQKAEAIVRIASRVEPTWLETLFPQSLSRERRVSYDESSDRVVARTRVSYRDLPLRESGDAIKLEDDVAGALRAGLHDAYARGELTNEASVQFTKRLQCLAAGLPAHRWPADVPREAEALALFDAACELAAREPTKANVVRQLASAARDAIPYPLRRALDQYAPEAIVVPTGSAISLDWSNADVAAGRGPILAVRLQEMFGLPETPRVLDGALKVTLHLLGPNYRPVQVTDDLASFWRNTYPQVRKDLRARYPKHSWPDDPLVAEAIRGARRRPSS